MVMMGREMKDQDRQRETKRDKKIDKERQRENIVLAWLHGLCRI